MEGKLGTDELANFLNRASGGGSSDVSVSGDRTITGAGRESWIVVNFNFPPADMGAVVIRMTIPLIPFRLVLVPCMSCGFMSPPPLTNSMRLSLDKGGGS